MPVSRTFFASLLLAVTILSGAFALFGVPAELMLFRSEPYLEALEEVRFFERFPDLLAGAERAPGTQDAQADALRYLGEEDLARIYRELMPADWLREQGKAVFEQLFDHLNFAAPELRLVVSLREVKERLAGSTGGEIAGRVVESWPACTAQQVLEIAGLALSGRLEGLPTCRPPDELMGVAGPLLNLGVQGFSQTIPDELDLADFIPARRADGRLAPAASPTYRAARQALRFSPLLAVLPLAALLAIAARSRRELLNWLGLALAGAGLAGIVLAVLAGLPLLMGAAGRALLGLEAEVGSQVVGALLDAARVLAGHYLLVIGIAAGLTAAAGAALVVLGKRIPAAGE